MEKWNDALFVAARRAADRSWSVASRLRAWAGDDWWSSRRLRAALWLAPAGNREADRALARLALCRVPRTWQETVAVGRYTGISTTALWSVVPPEQVVAGVLGAVRGPEADRYEWVGLRAEPRPVAAGGVLPPSRVWDDGAPTESYLEGTSAVGVRRDAAGAVTPAEVRRALGLLAAYLYPGCRVVVAGSQDGWYGEDDGEVVLRDAVVLAVVGDELLGQ